MIHNISTISANTKNRHRLVNKMKPMYSVNQNLNTNKMMKFKNKEIIKRYQINPIWAQASTRIKGDLTSPSKQLLLYNNKIQHNHKNCTKQV